MRGRGRKGRGVGEGKEGEGVGEGKEGEERWRGEDRTTSEETGRKERKEENVKGGNNT